MNVGDRKWIASAIPKFKKSYKDYARDPVFFCALCKDAEISVEGLSDQQAADKLNAAGWWKWGDRAPLCPTCKAETGRRK